MPAALLAMNCPLALDSQLIPLPPRVKGAAPAAKVMAPSVTPVPLTSEVTTSLLLVVPVEPPKTSFCPVAAGATSPIQLVAVDHFASTLAPPPSGAPSQV